LGSAEGRAGQHGGGRAHNLGVGDLEAVSRKEVISRPAAGAVNFGTVPAPCACPPGCHGGRSWLSTDPDRADGNVDPDGFTLESSEAVLLLV
jgi:hypothetical protein